MRPLNHFRAGVFATHLTQSEDDEKGEILPGIPLKLEIMGQIHE
jgi:hypothetical protein